MEQLKDVVQYFVHLAGRQGVGRTVLTKLVYFAELESWATRGEPLTGTAFYRYRYGAWAPDVRWVAERSPSIEFRKLLAFYPETRYRSRAADLSPELTRGTRELLDRIFATYGRLTASRIGRLSKETTPMQATPEGTRLDLSVVAPATLHVRDETLASAQADLDRSIRGDRHELDDEAIAEHRAWRPARRRAARA